MGAEEQKSREGRLGVYLQGRSCFQWALPEGKSMNGSSSSIAGVDGL